MQTDYFNNIKTNHTNKKMISIIIVTYNTRQMTSECIDSIFEKTKDVDFEVILVDNASSDGSKDFFEKDNRIKYIYSKENLGFGGGNNLGYEHSNGNYIFLLNSDTLLVNNAIKEFYDYMQNAPKNVGCIGCVLQDKFGRRIHSYHTEHPSLCWFFKEILCFSIPKLYNPYKRRERKQANDTYPTKVAAITGADLFIRRETIEKCGMFDTDFFMYYEETEMQYRFQRNGYYSFVIDTPKIIHLVGSSSKNKKNVLQRLLHPLKSRFIYAKKNFPSWKVFLLRIMHLLMVPRILITRSSWIDKKNCLKTIWE